MLPSLISLSDRLFLLVEIINLALSCYLVCQLCMWCILQFKGVEVLSDCFHCWPEYLVWKDYIFRDCLALLVWTAGLHGLYVKWCLLVTVVHTWLFARIYLQWSLVIVSLKLWISAMQGLLNTCQQESLVIVGQNICKVYKRDSCQVSLRWK